MCSILRAALAGIAALAFAGAAAGQQKSEEELFKLLKTETIGALRLEMTEAEVKRILPARPARGRERHWAADGRFHQTLTYAQQSPKLGMVSGKKGGAMFFGAAAE